MFIRSLFVYLLLLIVCAEFAAAGETRHPKMRPATVKLMRLLLVDDTEPDKAQLAMALGRARVGDKKTIAILAATLADSDPLVRAAAAFALGQSGNAKAARFLTPLLVDKDEAVRIETCRSIGRLKAVKIIAKLPASDAIVRVRMAVYNALGEMGEAGAAILVKRFSAEKTPAMQAVVLRNLSRTGARPTKSLLVNALGKSDVEVRMTALEWLGKTGQADDISQAQITHHLADKAALIRRAAIAASVRVLAVKAAPLIQPLLQDADHTVRMTAALALGKVGMKPSAAALTALLGDSARHVRRAAASALVTLVERKVLSRETLTSIAKKSLDDTRRPVRREGIWLLGSIRSSAGFPKIFSLAIAKKYAAKDPVMIDKLAESSLVMWTIGRAKYDAGKTLATVYFDLPDPSPLRIHGARTLGILKHRGAIPLISRNLTATKRVMGVPMFVYTGPERSVGIWALGEMADPRGLQALTKILVLKEPTDAEKNLQAIGKILIQAEFKAAIPQLQKALKSTPIGKTSTGIIVADILEKLTGTRPQIDYRPKPSYDEFFLNAEP